MSDTSKTIKETNNATEALDTASCSLHPTPETDAETYWNSLPKLATSAQIVRASLCRQMERERDQLRDQLRQMVNAKGRFNTQKEMEKLISLLPENVKGLLPLTGGELQRKVKG